MVKKVIKKSKPDFKVDMTNINTIADAYSNITESKVRAGISIRPEQHVSYVCYTIYEITKDFYCLPKKNTTVYNLDKSNKAKKKPNVFKRFWNWITRKK